MLIALFNLWTSLVAIISICLLRNGMNRFNLIKFNWMLQKHLLYRILTLKLMFTLKEVHKNLLMDKFKLSQTAH